MTPHQLGPRLPRAVQTFGEAGLWHLEHDRKGRAGKLGGSTSSPHQHHGFQKGGAIGQRRSLSEGVGPLITEKVLDHAIRQNHCGPLPCLRRQQQPQFKHSAPKSQDKGDTACSSRRVLTREDSQGGMAVGLTEGTAHLRACSKLWGPPCGLHTEARAGGRMGARASGEAEEIPDPGCGPLEDLVGAHLRTASVAQPHSVQHVEGRVQERACRLSSPQQKGRGSGQSLAPDALIT